MSSLMYDRLIEEIQLLARRVAELEHRLAEAEAQLGIPGP